MLLIAAMMALVTAHGWGVVEVATAMQCSRYSHHHLLPMSVGCHVTNGMLLNNKPVVDSGLHSLPLLQTHLQSSCLKGSQQQKAGCHAYLSTVANLLQSISLNGTHSCSILLIACLNCSLRSPVSCTGTMSSCQHGTVGCNVQSYWPAEAKTSHPSQQADKAACGITEALPLLLSFWQMP